MRARLLVADDDEHFAHALCKLLRRFGYDTHAVYDADQALREIEHARVDLVIADIHMPGNSALELLDHVGSDYPELPVILTTGRPAVPSAVQALRLGAGDYLVKPIDYEALRARVDFLLARAIRTSEAKRALSTLEELVPVLSHHFAVARSPDDAEREMMEDAPARRPEWDELSEREQEVVLTFARSPAVVDVARTLGISLHTVRNHFRAIYRKLNVRSQAELIAYVRALELP